MPALLTAFIREKMSLFLPQKNCCTSIQWSASIVALACPCARCPLSLPWTTCQRNGRTTLKSMQSTTAGEETVTRSRAMGSDQTVMQSLSFHLRPLPPFRLDLTAWALRRRARNIVDRWDGVYRRVLVI